MTVLLTIEALNASDAPELLYFSDGKYIDDSGNEYVQCMADAPEISVIANDGGLLDMFADSSIGDVSLNNVDGHLNYLADYALDGRPAKVYFFDGTTVTQRFGGTVGRVVEQNNQVVLALKAYQETLNNKHPMAVYAGDNVLPAGIEGTADTIKGKEKPKVFGDCRNIAAELVNESLLIYQVSSRSDCRITAVYDDGVRLSLYQVNGLHAAGVDTIAVDTGMGDIPAGTQIMFSNHRTLYTVLTGLSGGVIVLASPLTTAVPNNAKMDTINFYSDTNDLQFTDYFVLGEHNKGETSIPITAGVGAINVGDQVIFSGHLAVYTVQTGLSGGVIVIEDGLIGDIGDGDIVQVIGHESPVLWGSFQGYFRLTAKPFGTVTCDAVSIDDDGLVHQAGDVFGLIAAEAGLDVDSGGIAEFNVAGTVGVSVSGSVTTQDLLGKITASIAGYYHFIGSTLYLNLLAAPAVTADFTVYDYQIDSIERSALGLGRNGVPFYGVHCRYDRIETVQNSIDGNAPAGFRQRLKSQYRETTQKEDAVLTRHPLSELLEIESLLRFLGHVTALITRLLPIVTVRRDIVSVTVPRSEAPVVTISDTVKIITPKLGYAAGRNLVVIGFKIDDKASQVTLYLYG